MAKQDKKEKPVVVEEPKEKILYYEAVGRRKVSTARVRLYVTKEESMTLQGMSVAKGAIVVNSRPVESYFFGEVSKKLYTEPFRTTNTLNRFSISVKTKGGGLEGQLESMILGISRALEKVDKEKFRPILKKRGFLTRDARARERRKTNRGGKARAGKQSPKR